MMSWFNFFGGKNERTFILSINGLGKVLRECWMTIGFDFVAKFFDIMAVSFGLYVVHYI